MPQDAVEISNVPKDKREFRVRPGCKGENMPFCPASLRAQLVECERERVI